MVDGAWDSGPRAPEAVCWLADHDLVSVAALSGRVSATGLALACDLRLAAAGTVLVLGPLVDGAGPLVAAVGLARASAWCLTGAELAAEEALAAGLVTAVVPAAELSAAVDDLVGRVLAHPRDAVVEGKALLRGAVRRTGGEQWKAEADARRRMGDKALEEERPWT